MCDVKDANLSQIHIHAHEEEEGMAQGQEPQTSPLEEESWSQVGAFGLSRRWVPLSAQECVVEPIVPLPKAGRKIQNRRESEETVGTKRRLAFNGGKEGRGGAAPGSGGGRGREEEDTTSSDARCSPADASSP